MEGRHVPPVPERRPPANLSRPNTGTRTARGAVVVAIVATSLLPALGFGANAPLILTGLLVATLAFLPGRTGRNSTVPAILYFGALIATWLTVGRNANSAFELAVLVGCVPLAYVVGGRLGANESLLVSALRTLVLMGVVATGIALAEYMLGQYLIQQPYFFATPDRGGHLRARSIYPQSLVLGYHCCLTAVLAAQSRVIPRRGLRFAVITFAVAGAYVSGSRGALAVLAIAVVLTLTLRASSRLRSGGYWLLVGAAAAAFVLAPPAIRAMSQATSLVVSSDADAASAELRGELYRRLPTIVRSHPFGVGIGQVPVGTIVYDTPQGSVDASRTVDSEYALTGIKYGFLGLAFWLTIIIRHLRRLRARPDALNTAITLSLGFGTFLALQSWTSIAIVLAMLLGMQSRGNDEPANQDTEGGAEQTGGPPHTHGHGVWQR